MSKSRRAALAGLILILPAVAALAQESEVWRFVVGGDSRNCGDVVMPAVAAGARAAGASL
jgi:phosphomannomutase